MLLRKKGAVFSEINTKNVQFLNVKLVGATNNH